MFRPTCLRLSLVVALLASGTLAASLDDRGDRLYDPASGLEWLKLSYTAGQSYDQVAGGWNGFTTTAGYRFATRNEVRALFEHLGASETDNASNLQAGKSALALLGTALSMPASDLYRSWMTYDPASEPQTPTAKHVPVAVFGYGILAIGQGERGLFLTPGLFPVSDYSSPEISSALVRMVPEPTTWMLLAIGGGAVLWRSSVTRRARKG